MRRTRARRILSRSDSGAWATWQRRLRPGTALDLALDAKAEEQALHQARLGQLLLVLAEQLLTNHPQRSQVSTTFRIRNVRPLRSAASAHG